METTHANEGAERYDVKILATPTTADVAERIMKALRAWTKRNART